MFIILWAWDKVACQQVSYLGKRSKPRGAASPLACLSRVYFFRYPQMESLLAGYRQRNSDPSVFKVVPPRESRGRGRGYGQNKGVRHWKSSLYRSKTITGKPFVFIMTHKVKNPNWTKKKKRRKMHFMWVSMYLAQKYYLGTLYFTSPTGDGTAILRGHPSHAKV